MEVEEMQNQACKFPRIRHSNGRSESAKIGQKRDELYPDEDEAGGEVKRGSRGNGATTAAAGAGRRKGGSGSGAGGLDITSPSGLGKLYGWPSSRIVRVSRASGGKDRHSKVLTSKGLRDRRVRLSVNTAIQFYDLQDRLGYDQPSKAVEWLLKTAASSIAELPSIKSFPETPQQQLSDEKRSCTGTEHGLDSAEVEMDDEPILNYQQQQQQRTNLSKSACSSTSETSKGSGLSLSRSESRIKARERARERAAEKEKEKENESSLGVAHQQMHNVNPISQNSSFTELLTNGINSPATNVSNTTSPDGSVHQNHSTGCGGGGGGNNVTTSEANFFQKSSRHWSSAPMDYFAPVILGTSSTSRSTNQTSAGFLGQIQLGNPLQHSLTSVSSPLFSVTGDHHSELPHFSFVPDHLVPVVTACGGNGSNNSNGNGPNGNHSDYNLNFTISSTSSSGLAGFNRGTLQSNSSSPSVLPHIQRFSPIYGTSTFFLSATAPPNAAAPVENHNHFLPGFDARLQLHYGDGGRHSDQKGKGKN